MLGDYKIVKPFQAFFYRGEYTMTNNKREQCDIVWVKGYTDHTYRETKSLDLDWAWVSSK